MFLGLFTSENVVFQKTNEVFINDAHWPVTFVNDFRPFQNLINQKWSCTHRWGCKSNNKLLQKVKLNRIWRSIWVSGPTSQPTIKIFFWWVCFIVWLRYIDKKPSCQPNQSLLGFGIKGINLHVQILNLTSTNYYQVKRFENINPVFQKQW